jgi:hypothetical protein
VSQLPALALTVAPEAIPSLREAFERAIVRLDGALASLRQSGYLHEAWLGDEVSERMRVHYNRMAIDGDYPAVQAFTDYRNELTRVIEHLKATEAGYRQTEAETAATFHA